MNYTHHSSWHAFAATLGMVTLFSLCATAIMTYVSLAVPIGPWIDPTLALISLGVLALVQHQLQAGARRGLIYAIVAGSLGGIIASAVAFSLPTLHFLDAELFQSWLADPLSFVVRVASLVLVAGGLGLVCARYFGSVLLSDSTIPFPIAQLVHKTIATQGKLQQSLELLWGALAASFFSLVQLFSSRIPRFVTVLQGSLYAVWRLPKLVINLDIAPMLLAIGFITGHVITIPFIAGALIKIMIAEPCHRIWYATCVTETNFLIAFCSGLVVHGAVLSFWSLRKTKLSRPSISDFFALPHDMAAVVKKYAAYCMRFDLILVIAGIFFWSLQWAGLSLIAQLYLIGTTIICAQELMVFMGRVGLAPLGRFAFFVMVPGLFLFGFSPLQATLVAAFVEIAGGVAASSLSGYKVAQLSGIAEERLVYRYQWCALLICAVVMGVVLLVLINSFGLGAGALVAQRAQSRALLIRAHELHFGGMALGFIMACVLHLLHINTTLVLGGLLTQLDWSLLLILGGLLTYLCQDKERYYPFWSGVFTTSSLWMIGRAFWR